MDDVRQRLQAAIQNLRDARQAFDDATRNLDWQTVDVGAQWSVLDHVRHVSHPGAYPKWIHGLATDRSFALPSFGGPQGYWQWTRQNALDVIDEQIALAQSLSPWQLTRKATMGRREVDVIDLLNGMAGHYRHHADDIRRMTGQTAGAAAPHPETA